MDMFDRLESISRHYEEIQRFMTEPDIVNDTEKYLKLMRESSDLEPLYTTYKRYLEAVAGEKEALEMLASEKDPEMIELAKAELAEAKENQPTLIKELQILLLPKDENDDKNIIMEIRGGAGGDEAALFAAELYRMYINYAERRGYKTELMSVNETGIGGMKEAVFVVTGKGAYSRLKYEAGVHRVQRVPVTESGGRIHTSTATVAVMPEAEDVDVEINPADVKMEVFRSSGAGGQHINKTSSAVRLIHIPTGIVVACQEERSQLQNRNKAMQMLKARLYLKEKEEQEAMLAGIRGEVKDNGWGSQIRSYVLQPYRMVKDLRSGEQSSNTDAVLDGDIDRFITAYLKWMQLGCPDRRVQGDD